MIVRWKSEIPGSGYEQFVNGLWVDVRAEIVEQTAREGKVMTWNPSDDMLINTLGTRFLMNDYADKAQEAKAEMEEAPEVTPPHATARWR